MTDPSTEDILLLYAKSDVADVVDVCIRLLTESAAENNWELNGFIDEFRYQFNKKITEFKT